MSDKTRPNLAPARRNAPMLEAVRTGAAAWDADAYHVMNERDSALIEQELLHGAGSSKFVYQFKIQNTEVTGISVVGAAHVAAHYGGIQHRLIGSIQKRGSLFIFTSYPAENVPMQVHTAVLPDLAGEDDFYSALCEVKDVKTGNSVQMESKETRLERRRDGSYYERPHFDKIAQSKARRNAILAIIPQDIQIEWKQKMLALGKGDIITTDVLAEKRSNVLRFAASKAIALDRRAIEALTMEQITGLGDAAREGQVPAFVNAARALGLDAGAAGDDSGQQEQQQQKTTPPTEQKTSETAASGQQEKPGLTEQQQEQKSEAGPTADDDSAKGTQETSTPPQGDQQKPTEEAKPADNAKPTEDAAPQGGKKRPKLQAGLL